MNCLCGKCEWPGEEGVVAQFFGGPFDGTHLVKLPNGKIRTSYPYASVQADMVRAVVVAWSPDFELVDLADGGQLIESYRLTGVKRYEHVPAGRF